MDGIVTDRHSCQYFILNVDSEKCRFEPKTYGVEIQECDELLKVSLVSLPLDDLHQSLCSTATCSGTVHQEGVIP